MKIILLGAPGTGKGTQAKYISKKFNIPHISSGDILRETIFNSESKKKKKIQTLIESGKLVPDQFIMNLINHRISQQNQCLKGFILDGFPRNINQARLINRQNIEIDFLLEIKISKKKIIERITGRRIHLKSGRVYHTQFSPPKKENIDDLTGEKLVIRKDDTEKIVKKRIQEYKTEKRILINFFLSKKKKVKYFQINGEKKIKQIKEKIFSILKTFKKKKNKLLK